MRYLAYLNPFKWTAVGYANAMLTIIAASLLREALR